MNELKLMWENSPDTPLKAANLSKFISQFSDSLMLYIDNSDVITNPDNKLKFRNNSKVNIKIPQTNAYFNFDDSVISHDSRYTPTSIDNTTYRIESDSSSKSLAIEEGTTNLVSNPSFENSFTDWTLTTISSTITINGDSQDLDYSASIDIDAGGDIATLSQIMTVPASSYVSFSFYYKNNISGLKFLIVGDPSDPINRKYWKSVGIRKWEANQVEAELTLSSSGNEWVRYEIPDIYTSGLLTNEIEIRLYSDEPLTSHKVDTIQLEEGRFCSSYIDGIRGDSELEYDSKIFRLDEGTIDLKIQPKWFESVSTLFVAQTSTVDDAIKLYFDTATETLNFSIYDTNLSTFKKTSIALTSLNDDLKDKWLRIICTWNKDVGQKLYLSYDAGTPTSSLLESFTPFTPDLITNFQIGGRYDGGSTELINGMIDGFKINYFEKADNIIIEELSDIMKTDDDIYKIFENPNQSIVLDSNLLDTGSAFANDTVYYVWVCDNFESLEDNANIIISTNPNSPTGYNELFSSIIGGFKTDGSALPIANSLWDVSSFLTNTVHAERLMIHGKDTNDVSVEIRSYPFGDDTDATFNITTYFTDDVYFRDNVYFGPTDFLNINPSGWIDIDNIRIDDNSISSINGVETLITADTGQDVHIEADNINIDSTSGTIQLDHIRINEGRIYSFTGYNLLINGDMAGSDIIVDSNTGTLELTGNINNIHPIVELEVNTPLMDINVDTYDLTATTTLNINCPPGISLNASGGDVNLENVKINGSIIGCNSDLYITSDTNSVIVDGTLNVNAPYNLTFDSTYRQNIDLFSTTHGIGVQTDAQYLRTDAHFAFYKGGAHNDSLWNSGGGVLLAAITDGVTTTVDPNSRFYAGKVHNAIYNDLAECWNRDISLPLDYNMVVVQTKNGVRLSKERAEKGTVGVISDSFGFLLNDKDYNEKDINKSLSVPIAISGRVKVGVNVSVEIGDELVGWEAGFATKANIIEKVFKRDRLIGRVDSVIDEGKVWIKVY